MLKKAIYEPLVRLVIILLVCLVTLYGCGDDEGFYGSNCDCDDEMAYYMTIYGEPEEIHRYDDADYHCHTWWYWSQGLSVTFEWFDDFYIDFQNSECCKVSTYTFEPSYDERGRLIIDLLKEEKEGKTERPNHP